MNLTKKRIIKKILIGFLGVVILSILIIIINLIIFERKADEISSGKPIEIYYKSNSALLIIDIQEATTGKSAINTFYRDSSDSLIFIINRIARKFKNQKLPIIYIRSEITNPLTNILNNSFEAGSYGAQFDKRLKLFSSIEIIKDRNDSFIDTELDNILMKNKINKLYIAGLDAAFCINSTIQAAKNRNYKVSIIKEGIISETLEMKDSMIVNFIERGVEILNIDDYEIDNLD